MKICLQKYKPFQILVFWSLCFLGINLNAQSYFSLTDISINPAAPDNYNAASISLSGLQQDSCTTLDFFESNLLAYDLNIQMDWDSIAMLNCNGNMLPWTTTIELGILPDGVYTINLTGTNFTDDSGDPLSFVVTDLATDSCGTNNIFWVTSSSDQGPGSLREAIDCANLSSDLSTILFDIPGGGPQEIRVGTANGLPLPVINSSTIIDATTQPGYDPAVGPMVSLTGRFAFWSTNSISGLSFTGSNSQVYGLDINSFPDNGILLNGADFVTIGKPDGSNMINLNGVGFDPSNTPNNYDIGTGIRLINAAQNNTIQSNFIGTSVSGGLVAGNQYCGIFLQSDCDNNLIGGQITNLGNNIANNANAIRMETNSDFNEVSRNQFSCNDSIAVKLMGAANNSQAPPIIDSLAFTFVKGTASPGDRVDVYTSANRCEGAPCQGNVFLGSATTNTQGLWILNGPFETADSIFGGEVITAIATDVNRSSSEFAKCNAVVGLSDCTDPGGVIWVTNAQDTGIGSLRSAMVCADTTIGANWIYFDIPGTGPFTIDVGSVTGTPLPAITDLGTVIDGTTQPGHGDGGNFAPQIVLNGLGPTWNTPESGLYILGNYTEIYGLEIIGFPNDGILIQDAVPVTIGAADKGNVIYNNGYAMDVFPGLPLEGPFEGSGIALTGAAKRVTISGNYIGTDYSQTITDGNEYCGILIEYDIDFVIIGGSNNQRNVIANNAEGIRVKDESFGISIHQNSFMCNDSVGIRLEGVASGSQKPPTWDATSETSLTMLSGVADAGDDFVEIFLVDNSACSAAPCQGKIYLGSAPVASDNSWVLNAPFAFGVVLMNGDLLVATAIDNDANTSEFSECHIAANCMLSSEVTSIEHASCDLANGSFTITPSGGPAPYVFSMGLGEQSSGTFTDLAQGVYNINITDAYTCPAEISVSITDPGLPMTSVQLIGSEACDMQDGFVIMNQGSGAVGPYTYDIGTGNQGNNPNFINLGAGDYNVTITDSEGCTNVSPVTIPFVTAPVLTIPTIENEICSGTNGSFTAEATMGSPTYNYSIGGAGQTNATFDDLPAGTYDVTVTDDRGCTDTEMVTFANEPGPTSLTAIDITPDYCGQSNGTFTLDAIGGTEPYLYDMGNGPEESNFFENILGGFYAVTVTDVNQCTAEVDVAVPAQNGADLAVASSTSANCGQASGAVTISATAGLAPYSYNIGNGNQSTGTFGSLMGGAYVVTVTDANDCITTLPFTISDIGGPTPSISALTNATCEQFNGAVTIFATGGMIPFSYDIGNGNTGNPSFINLSPGDYNVTITDAANCSSIQPLTIENEGLLALASFTFNEVDGVVDFTNTAVNGNTYVWDFGDGTSSTLANPNHTYVNDGDYNVCLTVTNDCGPHTSCQSVSIQTAIEVSGIIEKENGVPVANVDVFISGLFSDATGTDGAYLGTAASGPNFDITPVKDTLSVNGVSGFDIFLIQQHILFINFLDSPYKIIAADVNHSETVSTFDTYLMQQVILGNRDTFPNNTSWRFVIKSFNFPDPADPFLATFPEEFYFNGLMNDTTDLDFIAIKVGDVTLDANAGLVEDNPSGQIEMIIPEINWKTGDHVSLPIRIKDVSNLAALELNFDFDASVLNFEGITTGDLLGLDQNDFNLERANEGILSLAWYDKMGLGQKLDTDKVIAYLNFTAHSDGNSKAIFELRPHRGNKKAYLADGEEMEVRAAFTQVETSQNLDPRYELNVQPNPFDEHVDVLLKSPVSEVGLLSIYDVSGRLIHSESIFLEKNNNQFRIRKARFGTKGVYFVQVKTKGFVETVRVTAE